ncbi:uncharacterized protein EHS24_003962 [Apiotrichum porosum]|uniref:Agd3 C-terminal domain-containing protein n=1 Tax=Apiotrichum porosum TaxID=105984 RepID=A0A427XDM7_9TREE|nr:uncharacterized protein EHS24_003962 [Apiotrichum porosum]RSH77021.1 hypothetical protein EHS24_003962 [Apiotrichum porosum]
MALDQCEPSVSYTPSDDGTAITHVVVTAANQACSVVVPVTIPSGSATAAVGSIASDQVGSEPPIQWVTLNGGAATVTLNPPISI